MNIENRTISITTPLCVTRQPPRTNERFRGGQMCPACIASTAVMVAGVGSTGGILAVCIGKFRKLFKAKRLGLFQKIKEKKYGNK